MPWRRKARVALHQMDQTNHFLKLGAFCNVFSVILKYNALEKSYYIIRIKFCNHFGLESYFDIKQYLNFHEVIRK